MYKVTKCLLTLLLVCFSADHVMAQWLEAKTEKDERSISIKMKDGVPSSRVVVSSSFSLSYSSNMGDVDNEGVGRGVANGLNTDTIHFFLVDDYKRVLIIEAEGYPAISVPLVLNPKETHRCLVYDPNKQVEEATPSADTSEWQYDMGRKFDYGEGGFSEDQTEALNWYAKAAEQGHGLAQVTLGVKYASGGDGFSRDAVKSARWFLIAAQQNYTEAQYAIANNFLIGNGVKQDVDKAYYWFVNAADRGKDDARYKIAEILFDGYGSDLDVDAQLEWFRGYADENIPDAQYVYAKLLLERKISSRNEIVAVEYLNRAIALSNVNAMLLLAERCFNRGLDQYNVIKGMELLRMAERLGSVEAVTMRESYETTLSRKEVYVYTKHFAEGGDADDMAALANMYYAGDGTDVDYYAAFDYFTKASAEQVEDAFVGLGLCYYYGFGVLPDHYMAFANFSKASDMGNNIATSELGHCYFYGHGVEQDFDKAFDRFTKANDGTNAVALNGLGMCYHLGEPVSLNDAKAEELFQEALVIDPYCAGLSLGDYYCNVLFDQEKGVEYYTLSAQAGNPEAQNKLGLITFKSGIVQEYRQVSRKVTELFEIMPNEDIVNQALEWFDISSKRNYHKGEYNHAYCLIAAMAPEEVVGSARGTEAVNAFRALAEKGYKPAMLAASSFYKAEVGMSLAEAYEWCQMAADSQSRDNDYALYKGILGVMQFDEALQLAAIMETTPEDIQAQAAESMREAIAEGCTFVYPRLYTYYKEKIKDRKSAKALNEQMELLSDLQKTIPKIVVFQE